ncbi:hypothetical protein OPQ81_006048 [Rhizoctonia solani]|nr:hypothetical protein OPQ81_006048 [Rhizoctonia solani]
MSRDGKKTGKKNGWFLVKHFKLHLQPEDQRKKDIKLDPLPLGISLGQIYSDFLEYLLKHTKSFVETSPDRIPLGKEIWEKYNSTVELVIAHPNVWSTVEQDFLRRVAIDSGFVDADKASRQVQFVTEAEASVHYCIHHSSLRDKLELFKWGGIFVNKEFEKFIRQNLKNLKLNDTQVDEFTIIADEDFEFVAKRKFGDSINSTGSEDVSIRVANTSFNRHGNNTAPIKIRRGCVKVSSSSIKRCFDLSVKPIISSVGEQLENQTVRHVLLVGGFGDSPYLREEFKGQFDSDDRGVVLANDSTAKAVADGSVIWNTLCSVIARTPRCSFGMICGIPCLPWMHIPGSEGRAVYIGPDGVPTILGIWSQIVKKGVPLDGEVIFREGSKHISAEPNPTSIQLEMDLIGYSSDDEPMWAWDKNEKLLPKFKEICTIKAQLYNLEGALKPAISMTGVHYWYLDVDVCVYFGTTELQAHLEWVQNGIRRKGPATVVPGRPIDL